MNPCIANRMLASAGKSIAIAWTVLFLAPSSLSCHRSPDLQATESHLDAVFDAWKSLVDNDAIGLVRHSILWIKNHDTVLAKGTTQYNFRHGGYRLSEYQSDDASATIVEGINPLYTFALRKHRDSAHYSLERLTFRRNESAKEQLAQKARTRSFHQAHTLKFFFHITWPKILNSKGLAIYSWEDVHYRGIQCVKVRFNLSPSDNEFRPSESIHTLELIPCITDGEVYLRKDRQFVPVGFEGTFQSWNDAEPVRYQYFVEFEEVDGHYLPIKRVAKAEIGVTGSTLLEERYEYLRPIARTPSEQFTLPAFGLPEPVSQEDNWPLWLIFLAVAATAGLCFFMLRAYRRTRK